MLKGIYVRDLRNGNHIIQVYSNHLLITSVLARCILSICLLVGVTSMNIILHFFELFLVLPFWQMGQYCKCKFAVKWHAIIGKFILRQEPYSFGTWTDN